MPAKKHMRKFLLDASANYIFFVPIYVVLNSVTFLFGLPAWDINTAVTYALTAVFGSFLLGGVYGKVLDFWRRKFNYK